MNFEQLGLFYLGAVYDPVGNQRTPDPILYDSKDLMTHAVCVGMTGSGKTGLCIGLLEEAAIDGIPAIVIDPKGDLSNLLLTFPELQPADFEPWINEDEARRKGVSPQEYAAQQAETWKKGLLSWGQDGSRIRRLREAADFAVYTPGSSAGIPVSVLTSFSAPGKQILEDAELLRERISITVSGLLGLIGVEANPVQSREHILLSALLANAWRQGTGLDLATLIQQIQTPPVTRIGVLELETFYPSKERFTLAMQINNLLAAPGFGAWLEGEPMDVSRFLHTSTGKPRVSIFSIAHLNDSERMFFVSLLLTQVLGWVRAQTGTTSLRAVLYMDEIFGYFPPVANPPSKQPLLTLLKQARASGLGIVLATQNPVDLDYKGLANAGTWFIGRLQTEQDKARVLDGLQGVADNAIDRNSMDSLLSNLTSRVFVMNNVHDDEPVVFQTRWTLSYLRGPLTRDQIKVLMSDRKPEAPAPASVPSVTASAPASGASERPVLPPEVPQAFLAVDAARAGGGSLVYDPVLFGQGKVYFADAKVGVAAEQKVAGTAGLSADVPQWELSDWSLADLEKLPEEDALFSDLPAAASRAKSFDVWKKNFADWVLRTQKLSLLKSASSGQVSRPGEKEAEFRVRLQQEGREQRDRMIEKIRQKYAARIVSLEERIRRAEQTVQREQEQASHQKLQTAISFGTTILGALLGRKKLSASSLGRATTAARGVGRSMKESEDIGRAQGNVESLRAQLADLQSTVELEVADLTSRVDPMTETFETVELAPRKSNIAVDLVTLLWLPRRSQ